MSTPSPFQFDFAFAFDNDKFSDRTLCLTSNGVVHKEIHVTKAILSGFSDYFYKLFTNEMKEGKQTRIEIDVSVEDTPLFYCLVKSFYTGVLSLDQAQSNSSDDGLRSSDKLSEVESLFNLLRVANRFLIEKRYADCFELLEKVPRTVSNVCYMYTQLEEYKYLGVEALRQSLKYLLLDKFKDFDKEWENNEFLDLPFFMLSEILKRSNLLVTSESTILQALRKWFNHCPFERVDDLVSLLKLVRFTQMKPTYLSEFLLPSTNFFNTKDSDIEKSKAKLIKATFKSYIDAAIIFHTLPRKFTTDSELLESCLEGGMPKNWLRKRVGYKSSETSEILEFNYDANNVETYTESFFFRGVSLYFGVTVGDDQQGYCYLCYDLAETIGKEDKLKRSFTYNITLQAFNRTTSRFENIFSKNENGFTNCGRGASINEKLNPNNPNNPYFDPTSKIARLRAYASIAD